jgi:hypothetical protein
MAYVYRHSRKDNNEVFYIGIGSMPNRATSKHGRNKHWRNIVSQTDYIVDILNDNISWDECCEKEKEYIKFYGRKDIGDGSLVNLTSGGNGTINRVFTEEHREKLRGKVFTEEHKRKIGLAAKGRNIGRKHSEEDRKIISERCKGKNIGRILSEETKKKIGEKSKGRISANKGKKMSDEQKKKISETLKKNPVSYWKGKSRDEETKRKIRDKLKTKV